MNETPEQWLERTLKFAEMIGRDTHSIYLVYDMMKNPLTLEQARSQIAKGCPALVRYSDPKNICKQ